MNNDLDHLRTWFTHEVRGEFSLRAVEAKLQVAPTTIFKFVKGTRPNLGDAAPRIFEWAKQRGYDPERQYDTII